MAKATVTNEGKTVATRGTDHLAIATGDDTCLLPNGNAQGFPNQVPSTRLLKGATVCTTIAGQAIWTLDGEVGPLSDPEHPGTRGGVRSAGSYRLEAKAVSGSRDVFVESAAVVRTDDPTTQNHANTVGVVADEMPEVVARGSATDLDVALVMRELLKMPIWARRALRKHGTKIVVCRESVTDYRTDLRGVTPRGWGDQWYRRTGDRSVFHEIRSGAPPRWDIVPGLYDADNNEVVIATTGHDTAEGAHIAGGHGSANLVLHEAGHALDFVGEPDMSTRAAFNEARDADFDALSEYERQVSSPDDPEGKKPPNYAFSDGPGQQETYAESFAEAHAGDPSQIEESKPNLARFWQSQPQNPDGLP